MSLHLDKDEFVILEARKSWLILFGETAGLIFSILIPIFVFSLIESIQSMEVVGNQQAFFMIITLSWIFVIWNLVFLLWSNHYLDILIITNKHLIDIEQKSIWVREVSVMDLEKIQDVTTEITGFVATVVGFGDIHIQTAGYQREFIVRGINNPNVVRAKINETKSEV
jgi:hypothetical protein